MTFYYRNILKIIALSIVVILLFLECGKRYPDQQYLALQLHSRWNFNGTLRWIIVTDSSMDDAAIYSLQIGVGTHGIVQAGIVNTDGRFRLVSLDGSQMGYGVIQFEPPIPILPPSRKVGETQTWEAVEIHDASPKQRYRVRVQSTVLEPSPVVAADTIYQDVLRIRIDYAYEDPSITPFLAGESEWWFARDIGIVRYQIGWYPFQDIISYGKFQY